ncbi:MAG: 50S ribosomal protein L32 [Saprospiraceae bacterium]|nr:50S ribosomal protein L32 [Saprospiraceae bacterium]MBP7699481.1 50S ribosomal protein L32 [Saprospiraceae bacterium]
MPNPRNKHSKRRTRARRTHDKAAMPQLTVCKATGQPQVYHKAHWADGNMYYRGQMVIKGAEVAEAGDNE